MDLKLWAILCCILMVVCIIIELLTPTMGGWTLTALVFAGLSIYLGFRDGGGFGYLMLAVNLTLFPIALWVAFHFLKRSPMIHRAEITGGSQDAPDAPPLTHLLGQSGKAITPLRPGGAAMIGQARIDVVTEGKFVDMNTAIKVIHVEGSKVVVEPE
jgi:membrane-bound serine protease (ClpP class)